MATVDTLVAWRAPDGTTLLIRPGTSDIKAASEVLTRRVYQKPRLGFIIEAGETWLDLGANIGAFTVFAATRGAKVVAVEPLPAHVRVLEANAEPYVGITIIEAAAVAGRHKTVTLWERPGDQSYRSSIVRQPRDAEPVTVPAVQFARLVRDHRPTGIKIDVEGAEAALLEDWKPPSSVRKVVVEWDFAANPELTPAYLFTRRMTAAGFGHISTDKILLTEPEYGALWNPSWQPNGRLIFAWRQRWE